MIAAGRVDYLTKFWGALLDGVEKLWTNASISMMRIFFADRAAAEEKLPTDEPNAAPEAEATDTEPGEPSSTLTY